MVTAREWAFLWRTKRAIRPPTRSGFKKLILQNENYIQMLAREIERFKQEILYTMSVITRLEEELEKLKETGLPEGEIE